MTIVTEAQNDGVRFSVLAGGNLELSGSREAVAKWKPVIAAHKQEVLDLLNVAAWCWRITLPEREILSFNVPTATHSEIRRIYPEALSIIPEEVTTC
jgi:hypothetical protein